MKISEVITVSKTHPSVEIGERQYAKMVTFFTDAPALSLPHGLQVKEKSDASYRWIGAFKAGELLGWAKLKPTTVAKTAAHAVELVYILPKYRKTTVVGWLFLYAKDIVGTPIVLGDEDSYGGVAFKDGEDLMKALDRTGKFVLSLVDMHTGDKSPIKFPLKDHRFTTVMIESMIDLQFVKQIAEAHGVPGDAAKLDYQREVAWLDDVEEDDGR